MYRGTFATLLRGGYFNLVTVSSLAGPPIISAAGRAFLRPQEDLTRVALLKASYGFPAGEDSLNSWNYSSKLLSLLLEGSYIIIINQEYCTCRNCLSFKISHFDFYVVFHRCAKYRGILLQL